MHPELFEILYAQRSSAAKTHLWSIEDSKLWYVTPRQSRYFLQLQRDRQYQHRTVLPEQELLRSHSKDIGRFPNVVDLGCGDGTQALALLQEMSGKVTYYPVDASEDMLIEAEHNARTLGFAVQPVHGDFTDAATIKGIPSPKLLLLLGNTVTNFDEARLLKTVKECMLPADRVLIGTTRGTSLVTTAMPMHTPVVPWSLNMLKALGLAAKDVLEGSSVTANRYTWEFKMLKDKRIAHNGREIVLRKGDRILNMRSGHYTTHRMRRVVGKVLKVEQLWYNEKFMVLFCKR